MFDTAHIDTYLDHRYRHDGLMPNTVRAYRADLMLAVKVVGARTDYEIALADFLNGQRGKSSARTIQRWVGTWRAFSTWWGSPVLINYKPPKSAPPTPHPIPEGMAGVRSMIMSSRNPKHRALCALTGMLGLRVNEAINVRAEDFRDEMLTVDGQAVPVKILRVVYGKGDRQRDVPVSDAVWAHLERAYMIGRASGRPLVPLSNRGARAAITRHGKNAGLSQRVRSHDMRATVATAAYDKTKDLRAVQEVLGHADSKTTQIYTQVSTLAKMAALGVAD